MQTKKALNSLLISPHRDLAEQFLRSIEKTGAFEVVYEMKAYPTPQVLDSRLRQWKPAVVFIDLATDLDSGVELIRVARNLDPDTQLIGLHIRNAPDAVLRSLRVGAAEFFHAPFDAMTQTEAAGRLSRLRKSEAATERELGKVIAFASAKKGSGASMLATQLALALAADKSRRPVLLDFDLASGTSAFYLKLTTDMSIADALTSEGSLDSTLWSSLVATSGPLDVIPAPEEPFAGNADPSRLHDVISYARRLYDWVVIDLPTIFHRISLMTLSETDKIFLVATPELPSLHLTRKAITLLRQIGLGKDRYFVLMNRNSGNGMDSGEMEKIFGCKVHASLPDDPFSANRVVTLGEQLDSSSELGRAIANLTQQFRGVESRGSGRNTAGVLKTVPLFQMN